MNISYDYEEFLTEIRNDLTEGLIQERDILKIVRSTNTLPAPLDEYKPIIDYYYDTDIVNEAYETMTVENVLKEMDYHNKYFK